LSGTGSAQVRPDAGVVPLPTENGARSAPSFAVQLQVATDAARARAWRERAEVQLGAEVRVVVEEGFHKLRVGAYPSRDAAEEMRRRAVAAGWVDAFVVAVGDAAAEAEEEAR